MTNKILIVVTSHDTLGATGKPTGYYLPEVTHPYFVLAERGLTIDVLSPKGGEAPMDPKSRNLDDPRNRTFLENPITAQKLQNTLTPDRVNPSDYAAVLFAGGHGTMWDFPADVGLHGLARSIYEQGGVVGAVCHGPAALVGLKLSNGRYLVEDKQIATFTNEEEIASGLENVVPFLLASKLIEQGAHHEKAECFRSKVVVDGRLVTGQNPASATGVGEAIAEVLAQHKK